MALPCNLLLAVCALMLRLALTAHFYSPVPQLQPKRSRLSESPDRVIRVPGTYFERLMLLCPTKEDYKREHFIRDIGNNSNALEYENALELVWMCLLCRRWGLAYLAVTEGIQAKWGPHAHVVPPINLQNGLFSMITQYANKSQKIRKSVEKLDEFITENELPKDQHFTFLDVIIILDLGKNALEYFVPFYYGGARDPAYFFCSHFKTHVLSPFYYVMYSRNKHGAIRKPAEQWNVTWTIIDYATNHTWKNVNAAPELFFGDVFVISIIREMLLIDCNEDVMKPFKKLVRPNLDQFQFTYFMCNDFWWQNIKLCGELYAESYNTTFCPSKDGVYSPPERPQDEVPSSSFWFLSEDEHQPRIGSVNTQDPNRLILKYFLPSILSMEPQSVNESESEYYEQRLSPLTSLTFTECRDLVVLFGGQHVSPTGEMIQLSPLIQVPCDNVQEAQKQMPLIASRYEVIIRGLQNDFREWQKPDIYRNSLESKRHTTQHQGAPAYTRGTVYITGNSGNRHSPIAASEWTLSIGSESNTGRAITPEILNAPLTPDPRPSLSRGNSPQMHMLSDSQMKELLIPAPLLLRGSRLDYNDSHSPSQYNITPGPLARALVRNASGASGFRPRELRDLEGPLI